MRPFVMATVRQTAVARHNRRLGDADVRAAPLLRNTLSTEGLLITGNFILPSHFLTTVSLRALLLLLGVGRGTFASLCF